MLRAKTLPRKKHRILYEWVEDEIEEFGFIFATEVRKEAGVLLGEDFGKYKKFARLSENLKKIFNLKAVLKPYQTSGCNHSHPIRIKVVGGHIIIHKHSSKRV